VKPSSVVRELWVGVLVAVAFIVFFVLLISVGEQHNLLAPKNAYLARFVRTQGLAVGAPVWLEGVPVGSVTDIRFPEEPDDFHIIVEFHVERSLAPRIRRDTRALIVSQGLIGEVLLGLERGSPEAPLAEPGAFLLSRETSTLEQFTSQGQVIADNIISISTDIRSVLARLERGEGLLARMLTDDEFAKHVIERLDSSTEALTEIAQGLKEGESFLGKILSAEDPRGAAAADSLFAAIERVEEIVVRVEKGEGTIGRLVTQDEEFDNVVAGLGEMSAAIRRFIDEVESGKGLLGELIMNEEAGREVMDNLESASKSIASITAKIDSGEGTIGAFIEDPALYEAMRDLVEGVEKSRVLRWFVRRKVAEGAEADLEAAEAEADPRAGVKRSREGGQSQ